MTSSIQTQYNGFLKTPQLLKSPKSVNAGIFETNHNVDITAISKHFDELSRQKYLGKRAELFLLQYLKSSERYSNIIHSLQIQNGTITIGEIDILCFDNFKQKWIHIELVYKLYTFIGKDNYDDFTQWIGPNLKDRLDYKIKKLKNHQLQICHKAEARPLFKELNIKPNQIETKICYKAKLYLPLEPDEFSTDQINPNCVKGKYYNFETFKTFKYSASLFYVPHKHDWLCQPETHQKWYDYKKAKRLLKPMIKEKRSQLLWRKTKTGKYFEDIVVWW